MALSTDYALRTGAYDPAHATIVPQENDMSCKYIDRSDSFSMIEAFFIIERSNVPNFPYERQG